ncbi:predicted protein [Chaetoceros tenuissimus]|uniref:Uncharacterized protein n=1 Tax=Chaetoceros tenuissimus TaxID=426638 RepID=A0AAD3HAC8_9STRA|nr:predicted protein [Chaetoceros tenuissimus]
MVLTSRNKEKTEKATKLACRQEDDDSSLSTTWCVSMGDEAFRKQDYKKAIAKYIESVRSILPSPHAEVNSVQLTTETMRQYCVATNTLLKLYAVYCKNNEEEDAKKSLHSAKALIEKVLSNQNDENMKNRDSFLIRVSALTLYSEIMEAQGDIYYANQEYTKADKIYNEALNTRQRSIDAIDVIEAQEMLEKDVERDSDNQFEQLPLQMKQKNSSSLLGSFDESTALHSSTSLRGNSKTNEDPHDVQVVKGRTSPSDDQSTNDTASSIHVSTESSDPQDSNNKKPTAEEIYAFFLKADPVPNQEYEAGFNDLRQFMSRSIASRSRVAKLEKAMKLERRSLKLERSEGKNTSEANSSKRQRNEGMNTSDGNSSKRQRIEGMNTSDANSSKRQRIEGMNTTGANSSRRQSQISLNQVSLRSDEVSIHSSRSNTPNAIDQVQPLPYKRAAANSRK